MEIIKFSSYKDLARLESYVRERYLESHAADSWLPERLHDIFYRVGAQETDEGRERSADHIYLWEENGAIQRCKKAWYRKMLCEFFRIEEGVLQCSRVFYRNGIQFLV